MTGVNKITTSFRIMESILKKGKAKAKKKGISFSAYLVELIVNDIKLRR